MVALGALPLLMAGALSCLDAAGPGGLRRTALFAVYPVFDAQGPLDGAPSDVDSIHITVANPSPPPDSIRRGRRILPGQDTIHFVLEVPMNRSEQQFGYAFQAIRSSDGMVLYSGVDTVTVRVGQLNQPEPVVAVYVGPGRDIKTIDITPSDAALRPSDTLRFNYTAIDSSDAVITGMPVIWRVTDTEILGVDQAGLVLAKRTGAAYVVVTSGARSSVRDSALVQVTAEPSALIGLDPTSLSFAAEAGGADPASQTVAVINAGGRTLDNLTLGTIQYTQGAATGWLTATLAATTAPTTITFSVNLAGLGAGVYRAGVPVASPAATNSPQGVVVTLTVSPPPITSITVNPGYAVRLPTTTVQLNVVGRDGSGNVVPTGTPVFTSRNNGVATVSSGGLVTAVAAGTATIVATAAGLSDSMTVVVPATGQAVAAPVADGRFFGAAKVNDTVRVLVGVDIRGNAPEQLGSYNAQLDWNTAQLRYVRTDVGAAFGSPVINETATGSGQLRFGAANANGAVGPAIQLVTVVFVANAVGTSPLTLTLTDLSAATTFTNLLPAASVLSGSVRVQ
jgi:hypothetical protein